MDIRKAFGSSLRLARKASGFSQEDFALVSSRTYLSSLERGLKSPTLEKMHSLAERMDMHPLTLMTLTYLNMTDGTDLAALLKLVSEETKTIRSALPKN